VKFEVLTAVTTVTILTRVFMSTCIEVSEKAFVSAASVDGQIAHERTC
jgi:hypothetical protein